MAEYLLINDIHVADRAPSSCTDTYLDDLFDILEATQRIAFERNAHAVIWAGDVIHFKTPSRTSHKTVRRLIGLAQSYPCPVYVVPGNHDLLNDRLDSLDETQPLGVMLASGAIQMLNRWMLPTSDLDLFGRLDPVYGVPWQMTWDDNTVRSALAEFRESLGEDEHHLVVTHAPLYPPGKELQYEFYSAQAWAAAMGNQGSVHYGHVHEPHGIYQVDGVTFSNPGALSRGSLHEHNLTRPVQIASWDSTTGQFEHITVPHKPASEVFRLVEVGQAKDAQHRLDSFLASIGETRIEITSIEAVLAHLRDLDLGNRLLDVAIELLEGAQ